MAVSDPMVFEELRDSMTALLRTFESANDFVVVDKQLMSRSPKEFKGPLRTVQVFFQEGDSQPELATRTEFEHDVTFGFFLSVAESATADLSGLDDPNKTPAEKKALLAASTPGSFNADRSIDELWRIVVQIIMDAVNEDLGLAKYTVSNRRLSQFRKNQPNDHGNLISLTGSGSMRARVTETITGATPVAPADTIIDHTSEFYEANGDPDEDASTTGVKVEVPTP